MNIQDSLEKLQKFFLENLIDPLHKRTKWIYTDAGRIELDKSPYPKILLRIGEQSEKEINQLGSYQTLNTDNVEMVIKAKMGNKYGLGDKKYTGKEFVAEIGKQAEELLKDKTILKQLDNFHSILLVGDNFEYDQNENPTYILRIQTQYLD